MRQCQVLPCCLLGLHSRPPTTCIVLLAAPGSSGCVQELSSSDALCVILCSACCAVCRPVCGATAWCILCMHRMLCMMHRGCGIVPSTSVSGTACDCEVQLERVLCQQMDGCMSIEVVTPSQHHHVACMWQAQSGMTIEYIVCEDNSFAWHTIESHAGCLCCQMISHANCNLWLAI